MLQLENVGKHWVVKFAVLPKLFTKKQYEFLGKTKNKTNILKSKGERIMSKKSKVLALLLCFAMLVVAMPIITLADSPSIEITGIEVDTTSSTEVITVTVSFEAAEVDQITLLATIQSCDVVFEDGEVTNVAYINQYASDDSEIAGGTVSFDVSKEFIKNATAIFVKMGGTDIDDPAADNETFDGGIAIVYGDVNGDGDIDSTDASLILQYYAKIITVFPIENQ